MYGPPRALPSAAVLPTRRVWRPHPTRPRPRGDPPGWWHARVGRAAAAAHARPGRPYLTTHPQAPYYVSSERSSLLRGSLPGVAEVRLSNAPQPYSAQQPPGHGPRALLSGEGRALAHDQIPPHRDRTWDPSWMHRPEIHSPLWALWGRRGHGRDAASSGGPGGEAWGAGPGQSRTAAVGCFGAGPDPPQGAAPPPGGVRQLAAGTWAGRVGGVGGWRVGGLEGDARGTTSPSRAPAAPGAWRGMFASWRRGLGTCALSLDRLLVDLPGGSADQSKVGTWVEPLRAHGPRWLASRWPWAFANCAQARRAPRAHRQGRRPCQREGWSPPGRAREPRALGGGGSDDSGHHGPGSSGHGPPPGVRGGEMWEM
ncbi:hypothetical protein N7532_000894 [Penicillium argentinense]|uniref:Uncharacterized protein n=1 Tax=Penicillium argentinense TaxID=1131581 RepID=A0A9W9G6G5_9EURO|nr:uncharacterized protein N7532_000894 [Penicillium argentinense]KAJ5112849.1 hypothetical protein N7532_000894 [Penicillium argentinense]